jgi:hypothetical protein
MEESIKETLMGSLGKSGSIGEVECFRFSNHHITVWLSKLERRC